MMNDYQQKDRPNVLYHFGRLNARSDIICQF
nr:MAG TPA: hypothetical protein [Caudoviricetes sp.]DAP32669.1 MAG TPA: hypothetical protein [Caudoviricetes sp.]